MNRPLGYSLILGLLVGTAFLGYALTRPRPTPPATPAPPAPVAAVDVTYDAQGFPVAGRMVLVDADNEVLGHTKMVPYDQLQESAQTFVKGEPRDNPYLTEGAVTVRRFLGELKLPPRCGQLKGPYRCHPLDYLRHLKFFTKPYLGQTELTIDADGTRVSLTVDDEQEKNGAQMVGFLKKLKDIAKAVGKEAVKIGAQIAVEIAMKKGF